MASNIYQKGDKGPKIRQIQEMLKDAGYYLSVDGIYGSETQDDVKDFQKQQGLAVDGKVGPNTLDILREKAQKETKKKSQQNTFQKDLSEQETIRRTQQLLFTIGHDLAIDGLYGPETESNLKDFQEQTGLAKTGEINQETKQSLLVKMESLPEPNIDQSSYPLKSNAYIRESYPKKTIVIHHTMGHTIDDKGNEKMSHVNHWQNLENRIGAAFSISYFGRIYQHFDPEYWLYHLGIEGSERDAEAIAIELCNEGALSKEGDHFTWFNGKVTYKRPQDEPVHHPWRKQEYWAPYSPAQMKALIQLIRHLIQEFGLAPDLIPHNAYEPSLLEGDFEGIYTHSNLRKDKLDVSPAFDYDWLQAGLEAIKMV